MAKQITSWEDSRGGLHRKEADALLVDIEHCLSGNRTATEANRVAMTPGIAKLVADNAEALLPLLEDWSRLHFKTSAVAA